MFARRRHVRLSMMLVVTLLLSLLASSVFAAPAQVSSAKPDSQNKSDDLKHPRGDKQRALHQAGMQKVLKGQAQGSGKNKVVQVAKGQFVELARQGEDSIFTVTGEFGLQVATHHGGHPSPAGPLHNQIPQPDRSVDNSTIWAPDFSGHLRRLLFSDTAGDISMRNFYKELSWDSLREWRRDQLGSSSV